MRDGSVRAVHGHGKDFMVGSPGQRKLLAGCDMYKQVMPGEIKQAFHGTMLSLLHRIVSEGLHPIGRRGVHMHSMLDRVISINTNKKKEIVFVVDVDSAIAQGLKFFYTSQAQLLREASGPGSYCPHQKV